MRVAYLINQYPKVSHSFIRREIQSLERQGWQVHRFALRGWDGELPGRDDERERRLTHYVLLEKKRALVTAVLRQLWSAPRSFFSAMSLALRMSKRSERGLILHLIYFVEACCVARWSRQENIHHLHAHFGTNAATVAMLTGVLGGQTWSFTVHGPEEFDKAQLIHLAEKIQRAAFVIAISSYGRSQLFRLIPKAQWEKIHVVHCGIDAGFYAAAETSISSTSRLICVGRLCEQKGQLLLVEAARLLMERRIDFELVLAGDGEMRRELEDLVARYELGPRIRFTGWINGHAVRAEILSARALVLPSFAEGLPVVIMEAMALGRPVVSTYIAGIPELVRDGIDGWLVPAGDVDALADAIEDCLKAPLERLAVMGKAARARVLERHDIEKETVALAALFSKYAEC